MPSVLLATVSIDIDIDIDTVWIFPSFADHFRVGFFSLLFLENFFFAPDSDRREGVAPRSCGGGGGGGGGRRDAPLFFSFPVPVAVHRRLSGGAVDAIDAAAFVFVCLFACLFVGSFVGFGVAVGWLPSFAVAKSDGVPAVSLIFFFGAVWFFLFQVAYRPKLPEYRVLPNFFLRPKSASGVRVRVCLLGSFTEFKKKIYCSFYRRVKGYSAPRLDFPCSRWT